MTKEKMEFMYIAATTKRKGGNKKKTLTSVIEESLLDWLFSIAVSFVLFYYHFSFSFTFLFFFLSYFFHVAHCLFLYVLVRTENWVSNTHKKSEYILFWILANIVNNSCGIAFDCFRIMEAQEHMNIEQTHRRQMKNGGNNSR